jgi:hypothetical protein
MSMSLSLSYLLCINKVRTLHLFVLGLMWLPAQHEYVLMHVIMRVLFLEAPGRTDDFRQDKLRVSHCEHELCIILRH